MKTKIIIVSVCLFYSVCGFSQGVKIDTTKNQNYLIGKAGISLPINANIEHKPFKITCNAGVITKTESNPLYVVDGEIITFEAVRVLDQKSIKTINVLKGLAATTLYGIDGRNGVILMTTNKKSEDD